MQVIFNPDDHSYSNGAGAKFPSVTWILAKSGLCDFSFVDEEVRARAMARGKSVHWLLQLEDEGSLNYRTVPNALKPYRKAYLAWKRGVGFVPDLIESPFISNFGYAGTLDRYGRLPSTSIYPRGSRAIVDFKSGGIQDWVRYQLAAYSLQVFPQAALAKHVRRIALALKADGTYGVKEFRSDSWDHDFSVFMEAKRRICKSM